MVGNQIPRIRIEPERCGTDGDGAAMLMEAYGVRLDEWQRLILCSILGTDKAGRYVTTSAGISCPRQNGKSEILIARCFYGLLVNGERILFTAHQTRSVSAVYQRLVNMFTDRKHPEVVQAVRQIRRGFGTEAIMMENGGSIEFSSRSRQAARGYAGISLLVYDEAQELTDEQAEALMSILSASATGIRQIIYAGTPPYIGCPGEVFRRIRSSCIEAAGRGEETRNSWHEWSIPEGENIDTMDKSLWYATNPALGYHLTEEFTAAEAQTLKEEGFLRERLGYWAPPAKTQAELAIDPALWDRCRSEDERPEGKTAYGVKFTADGAEVVLAGAVIPSNGGPARITLLAMEPTGRGLSWLADWLNQRYSKASCVVIDGRNGSDVLIDKLKDTWRFKDSIIRPSAQNVIAAASMLLNDLNENAVTWYAKQDELRESAITATRRNISGGWGFGGQTSAPIEACSLALWGCRTSKRNPQRQMKIG